MCPECLKWRFRLIKTRLAARLRPNPLRELAALPQDPLAGFRGELGRMRGRDGEGGMGKEGEGQGRIYGGVFTGSTPPRHVEKKIFWQCKKARPAKCER